MSDFHQIVGTLLQGVLNEPTKEQSERQLNTAQHQPGYVAVLGRIALTVGLPLPMRQVGALVLKAFVKRNWNPELLSKDERKESTLIHISEEDKQTLREILPNGIGDAEPKIRIAIIARVDFPEQWPNIFDILLSFLKSGQSDHVHGAMRCMAMLTPELEVEQLPFVVPVLMPELSNLFLTAGACSVETRRTAVLEYYHLVDTATMLAEEYPHEIELLLSPQWLAGITEVLAQPPGTGTDWGLKIYSLQALKLIIQRIPKFAAKLLGSCLGALWSSLTLSVELYQQFAIGSLDLSSAVQDVDGDVLSFELYIVALLEVTYALAGARSFRKMVRSNLQEMFRLMILFMVMTDEQVDTWVDEPNEFVISEDDDFLQYSARNSAQSAVLELSSEISVKPLGAAVSSVLQLAEGLKLAGNEHWWRLHEAALLSIGCVHEELVPAIQADSTIFPMSDFVANILVLDMKSDNEFVKGRALAVAAKYAEVIPLAQVLPFVESAVETLIPTSTSSLLCRLSACRALVYMVEHLNDVSRENLLPAAVQGLMVLANSATEETVGLVVETMTELIQKAPNTMQLQYREIVSLLLAMWSKYYTDMLISMDTAESIRVLAEIPAIHAGVVSIVTEYLTPVLYGSASNPPGVIEGAIDILSAAFNSVTVAEILSTLSLIDQTQMPNILPIAISPLIALGKTSEDVDVIESVTGCLRIIAKIASSEQLVQYSDGGGNALNQILEVLARLLRSDLPETVITGVGLLIVKLVMKHQSHLTDSIGPMLQACMEKISVINRVAPLQSLIMVLAHLLASQNTTVISSVMNILTTTMCALDQGNSSGLGVVLNKWMDNHCNFVGHFDSKLSVVALTSLLLTGDAQLNACTVSGDEIVDTTSKVIRTRSRTKKSGVPRREVILAPLRIVTVILRSYQDADEGEGTGVVEEDWDTDDENSDVDTGKSPFAPAENFSYLSDLVKESEEGAQQLEDKEVLEHPIYKESMKNVVVNCLQKVAAMNAAGFSALISQLKPHDYVVLKKIFGQM